MGFFSWLGDLLGSIAETIFSIVENLWNMVKEVFRSVIRFFEDLCSGLKNLVYQILGYNPGSVEASPVKPFIADMDTLLRDAPVVNAGVFSGNNNVMKGVYDTRSKQVYDPQVIHGNSMDGQTANVLAAKGIAVLG